ncbi:MAG: GGDEF domain-containing protein [Candidatus Saganbacteria bacterium]|nr:GGDEF domain-containing protein [Candidatus Saganbacteria bacterium]
MVSRIISSLRQIRSLPDAITAGDRLLDRAGQKVRLKSQYMLGLNLVSWSRMGLLTRELNLARTLDDVAAAVRSHVIASLPNCPEDIKIEVVLKNIRSENTAELSVPIAYGGEVIANFEVNDVGHYSVRENLHSILSYFSKDVSFFVGNIIEKETLVRLASTDELTGLYNRRFFEESIKREVSAALRYDKNLIVVMLDVDHFKNVNDTYGHKAGDMVLREVGNILREGRLSDTAFRFGGEEFTIIMPETDYEGAKIATERIRQVIENTRIVVDGVTIKITVSMGVAKLKDHNDDVVKRADNALYKAKDSGRNRVVLDGEGL